MSRIVVDPDELKRVAGYIAEAADAYSDVARELLERPRPAMPERLATAVDGGLRHAHDALEALSGRLTAEAYLLRTRASIVESGIASDLLLRWRRQPTTG